jgi:hypothetical protein
MEFRRPEYPAAAADVTIYAAAGIGLHSFPRHRLCLLRLKMAGLHHLAKRWQSTNDELTEE